MFVIILALWPRMALNLMRTAMRRRRRRRRRTRCSPTIAVSAGLPYYDRPSAPFVLCCHKASRSLVSRRHGDSPPRPSISSRIHHNLAAVLPTKHDAFAVAWCDDIVA